MKEVIFLAHTVSMKIIPDRIIISRDVRISIQQSTFPGQRRDATAAMWTTKYRGKKGSAHCQRARTAVRACQP